MQNACNSPLPLFRSHKTVRAAQIVRLAESASEISLTFGWDGKEWSTRGFEAKSPIFTRYMPKPGDYFVVYPDGYESISPKAAFEDGYRMVERGSILETECREKIVTGMHEAIAHAKGIPAGLEATERECAANAKAPRVALADIEAAIAERFDLTGDTATWHHRVNAEENTTTAVAAASLNILSICLLVMRNGFIVIGKSAPADPANFNAELGRKLAYEDAIRQLWPLMGFCLRQKLHDNAATPDRPEPREWR